MSSQLAKLWDYSSTVCVRRRRFLFLETNLILPGRGTPPSGSTALFSRIGAFPGKLLLLIPGSLTSYTFVYNP